MALIHCVRDKMKLVEVNKNAVCFYSGFRPQNLVSLEQLEGQLRSDGWVKSQDGSWAKDEGVVEEVRVKVEVNNMQEILRRY